MGWDQQERELQMFIDCIYKMLCRVSWVLSVIPSLAGDEAMQDEYS